EARVQPDAEPKSESDDEPAGIDEQYEPEEEPVRAVADGRRQQPSDRHRTEHEEADGNIASRTRSKIRRAPYRGTEREDADGHGKEVSGGAGAKETGTVPVGSEGESGPEDGRGVASESSGDSQRTGEPRAQEASGGHVRRREQHELEELERELRRVAHEEDEEPRIYVFA
ncbi:hypothetical protein F442_13090, partial [Phytophthora nicotianae P10297]